MMASHSVINPNNANTSNIPSLSMPSSSTLQPNNFYHPLANANTPGMTSLPHPQMAVQNRSGMGIHPMQQIQPPTQQSYHTQPTHNINMNMNMNPNTIIENQIHQQEQIPINRNQFKAALFNLMKVHIITRCP